MSILDDKTEIFKIDKSSFYNTIVDLANQFQKSWNEIADLAIPSYYIKADKIVICGMGASGIVGNIIYDLLNKESSKPVFVIKDYHLPAFVNSSTLVIAICCSGDTEETVSCFQEAYQKEAKLFAITKGGQIEKLCSKYGTPYYKFEHNTQPRAALGLMLGAVLKLVQKLGLTETKEDDVLKAIKMLNYWLGEYSIDKLSSDNPAKKIAQKLVGKNVVVWSAENLTGAGLRWKEQVNENAKQMAHFYTFPELHHNSISGLEFPTNPNDIVLILYSKYYNPRIIKRIEITKDILANAGIEFFVVEAESTGLLAEILSMILLGDLVGYYLAVLNGVDPESNTVIDEIKNKMK